MITKRLRDLPKNFTIPNYCPICKSFLGVDPPSQLTWITDGTQEGTFGFCCVDCAKEFQNRITIRLSGAGESTGNSSD